MKSFTYIIEVAGACNLRCPSCPQGNLPQANHHKGFMDVNLFKGIVEKIAHDPVIVQVLALYNWGEALLHPQLPELINLVKEHNFNCNISTNFNHIKNLEEIIDARPDQIRISVSGFSNETYRRTHRNGDIELVKSNMVALRKILDRQASSTRVEVCYHKYLDNTGKELSDMSHFSRQLGFTFMTVWALLMPKEKNLEYLVGKVSETDANLTDLLAIKPDQIKNIRLRYPQNDCILRSNQTTINSDGSVALCCAVYDKKYNIADNFLEISHTDLQKLKYSHPLCNECMRHGIYLGSDHAANAELDMIAEENVSAFINSANSNNLSGALPSIKHSLANNTEITNHNQKHSKSSNVPLVTIGLPVYNGERFLRQSLEALLAQDYGHFELIISDNASTDATPEICQEYLTRDKRIQYHCNEENRGTRYNFRKVLDLAAGKYFLWAADHDLWHPTLISKCVKILDEDPDTVLCYPRAVRIDPENNVLGLATNQIDTRGLPPAERYLRIIRDLSGGDLIYGVMRTAVLQKVDNNILWARDQARLVEMALVGAFAHIPEPLFYWRQIRNESLEYRKKTVPLTIDPVAGQRLIDKTLPELWRDFGEECLAILGRSSLSPAEKTYLEAETKKNFTARYQVDWGTKCAAAALPPTETETSASGKKSAKVLLTTSAAPSQTPFSTTEKRPPIGLGFLISVLREAGHEVFFIDNYLQPSNFLETDYLQKNQIDFVGIYANTICYRDTQRMLYRLEYLRQTGQWQGKIIIGGPHTSVALDTIPQFVDYVVQGEGEQAILNIVEGRVSERVVKCKRIQNLDDLPMPAWDYFVDLPYNWGADWFDDKPVFTMNTSRGCPFKCTFCSVGSIWGRRYTYFSAARIVAEIEHLICQYGAKGIYFREDNFTVNKKRTVEFCNLLLEKGIKISWACETRVDTLDRELLDLMVKAGLKAFYFGVESGSQRVLDFLQKGINVAQTKQAFQLCHEFGVKTAASVIVGVPSETPAEIQETIDLIKEIKPSVCWFNVFVGIPDSKLYRYTLEHKLHEFIDDRGLVYLKGHNDRVQAFYGGQWDAQVPVSRNAQGAPIDPKISVVMAVHNGGHYLEEAIKSILQQTYQNYEFIIIDDASTDETAQTLNNLDDFRVRVITNPENLGLTQSLNLGISKARGKYIARMDADDLSLPHRLEKQLDFLEKHPVHAMVGTPYYQIDETGTIKGLVQVLTEDRDLRSGLLQQNWFGHGSVMMRKEAFVEAGGYDERFKYAQDYDLWLRLADSHRLANLPEPLYCWRSTSSCISREKAKEQQYFARLAQKKAKERQNQALGEVRRQITGAHEPPLVSVIVPTFNRPDTLVATLQSILNQTYQNHEIIVVNDCGLDVADIVDWCNQRQNISYVRHDRNRGLAAARNTGLKLARGKYIAYLDDDDVFYPDHLETLVTLLESSDYRVAYTDAHRAHQVKQRGRYVTTHKDLPYSHDFNADHLIVANQFPVLCLMHEKACLEKAGFFDESLTTHEDWDLWIRLSLHYPFQHIKKVTCEFTWRQDGSTMTSQKAGDFVRTLEIIHAKYQEHVKDRPHLRACQQEFLQRQREALGISRSGAGQPSCSPQEASGASEISH